MPEEGVLMFNTFAVFKDVHPVCNMIELWNQSDIVTTHRRDTKLYQTATLWTNQILSGTFKEHIDTDWRIDNDLKNIFLHPVPEDNFISAVHNYILQFTKEYLPVNKSVLVRSYKDFIYNERTQISQLLWIMNKPPRKITYDDPLKYRKLIPDFVLCEIDTIIKYQCPNITEKRLCKLYQNIHRAVQEMETIIETLKPYEKSTSFRLYIAKLPTFAKLWTDGLTIKEFNLSNFAPHTWFWEAFIEKVERDFNLSLDYSEKAMKKRHKKKEV